MMNCKKDFIDGDLETILEAQKYNQGKSSHLQLVVQSKTYRWGP